jgi:hypothetical protein
LIGILGLGGIGLGRLISARAYSGGTAAVLRACTAYRVPDTQGAVSARWMEGQPVKIRALADPWAYAESADGDAGWVRRDDLVFY